MHLGPSGAHHKLRVVIIADDCRNACTVPKAVYLAAMILHERMVAILSLLPFRVSDYLHPSN